MDRSFDVAMRFYLRQLERKDLTSVVRTEYMKVANYILESNKTHNSYTRYSWLLDRYRRGTNE